MPTNRRDYPPNWDQIATSIKQATDWQCQQCGKHCYRPGEPGIDQHRDQRRVLTVHHINHIPSDCRPENLIALCSVCHLRADAPHHARNAKRTWAAKRGQPFLPHFDIY